MYTLTYNTKTLHNLTKSDLADWLAYLSIKNITNYKIN